MSDETFLEVLIVEDDPALREIYAKVLSLQGFRVVTASNGIQALNALRKSVPNVMLLDVLMPEMDGREFLRNIEPADYPDMRIIISSNVADQEIIEEMLRLGAHGHVLKSSITPNSLVELVTVSAVTD